MASEYQLQAFPEDHKTTGVDLAATTLPRYERFADLDSSHAPPQSMVTLSVENGPHNDLDSHNGLLSVQPAPARRATFMNFSPWFHSATTRRLALAVFGLAGGVVIFLMILRVSNVWKPRSSNVGSSGIKAQRMLPAFPSKTFPNHYTLVTGLYTESHGIVSNHMYDPITNSSFDIGQPPSLNSYWWGGEPLWVTVQKFRKKSGIMYWPGSEAVINGVRPTYFRPYNRSTSAADRINQVLQWLDLPPKERPSFLAVYFEHVDDAGHAFGPNSPQVAAAITAVDTAIGDLLQGLASRGHENQVNIVVVSDHGMASMDRSKVINLEGRIDLTKVRVVDTSPLLSLRPLSLDPIESEQVVAELVSNLTGIHPNFTIWRKEDIPDRFHYRSNARIAPVIGVSDVGWTIQLDSAAYFEPFTHGFDNTVPEMGAIFLASGPSFRRNTSFSAPGSSWTLGPPLLRNVDVYPVLCWALNVPPAPNNGSVDTVLPYLAQPDPVHPW